MRTDLLALGDDDLIAMTNLGTVRRARREVEEGAAQAELAEDAGGTVTAQWSDGPRCTIPGGKVLSAGRCTCPAVGTICRHLLRTVFAYQRRHAAAAPVAATAPWDPGSLDDAELVAAYGEAALAAARRWLADGVLAEVVRSRKPLVRLVGLDLVVRFLVPRDLRYVVCDLEGVERARLVCLAALLCRALPAERAAGLVVSGEQRADPRHGPLVERLLAWTDQALLLGAAGLPAALLDHGRGLEPELRAAGLHALADLLAEALADAARYQAQDALFAAERLVETLGELQIRADATVRPPPGIPLALVRGFAPGRPGERDSGRFIGVGCLGLVRRRSLTLAAVVQDLDTGSLATVVRDIADPATGLPRPAAALAATGFASGLSLHAIARGTLLSDACRREAGGRLVLGRGRHAATPQAFAWERLRAPLLVEDYGELRARLEALPPASLRARSLAGDTMVLRVQAVDGAGFDPVAQAWRWRVADADGAGCDLAHTFRARSAGGALALAAALASGDRQLFVTAQVRVRAGQLLGTPLAVVFENAAGRYAVMPWCDEAPAAVATPGQAQAVPAPPTATPGVLEQLLADAVVNGCDRAGLLWGNTLARDADEVEAAGRPLLAAQLRALHGDIAARAGDLRWRSDRLLPRLRELLQWHRLGLDVSV